MKKILVAIICVVYVASSCSKSDGSGGSGGTGGGGTTVSCTTAAKKFAADVNPIIQNFCNVAGCHSSGSVNGPGPLTNYTQVFNSRTAVRAAVSSGLMPQNTTLTAAQKGSITCWIDDGAQNN